MTDSLRSGSLPALVLAVIAAMLLGGCRTPGAALQDSALEPQITLGILVPDDADHAAADVAAAALVSDREAAQQAIARLEDFDLRREADDGLPTGLVPVARDLVNATLDDSRQYREATRELLDDNDLDPALRRRLDMVTDDDPLLLARARMRDSFIISFGRAFNAVAEPLGQSITNTSMAPYRLGRALFAYALAVYASDPLPLQERQALVHWKSFLSRHPDAPEASDLEKRVRSAESEWRKTQHKKSLAAASRALDRDQFRLALIYADRALGYVPEDDAAEEIRDEAAGRLRRSRADRARSISSARADDVAPPRARALAVALALPDGDVIGTASQLYAEEPDGPLADEAIFAVAVARGEAGAEDAKWELMENLVERDDTESNMARHANALYRNPEENAFRAFQSAVRRNRVDNAMWVLVGPYYRGFPDRGLPKPISWMIDAPSMAETATGSPIRLLQLPWMKPLPAANVAAHYGRRYLERFPNGEHAVEISKRVEAFEKRRGNWMGAYRVAETRSDLTIEELDEYREKAAVQAFSFAKRAERRDERLSALRNVAQEFADTSAGHRAGMAIRSELSGTTPHRIRMSRGFLLENPEVAGPAGLGLRPELLDGDATNGELHPEGIALLGGNDLAVYYIGPSGDGDDVPLMKQELIADDRLARLVSALEEASFENSLLDTDDRLEMDSRRDVFFERARLGLPTDADARAGASSDFSYRGMRERYGMVRSRESILPFDLVLKGSLSDMSLGAFPRIREPRQTPDAFLYR
jgi:hypothetical protein